MSKSFCGVCLDTNKGNIICGKCGQRRCSISPKARTPKKNAPAKEWIQFADLFLNHRPEYREQVMIAIGKAEKKVEEASKPKSEKLKHNLQFELVEFLVEYTVSFQAPLVEELLRNGRGFNKMNQKDLVKQFESAWNILQECSWTSPLLIERGELIQTLIFEKAFDL